MKTISLLAIISFLFTLSGCKNPLDESGYYKSTIDDAYNALLRLPGNFNFLTYEMQSSQVTLSWEPSERADRYQVKYGTTSGSYSTTASCIESPCTIAGLDNGVTYYFTVLAINPRGSTSVSSELVITNSFSISSVVVNGANSLTVAWTSLPGATSYSLKYGTASGSYSTTLTNQTSPTTVSGLTAGTTYYFMLTANNLAGSVNASAEVQGIPIGSFNLSSLAPQTGAASLTWGSATGATTYDILLGTASGAYSTTFSNRTSPSTVNSLTAGVTYYFKVRANNAYGSLTTTNELSGAVYQSLSLNIPFSVGTDSSYIFSNSSITDFTGGLFRLKPADQTDDDSSSSGFGGATHTGTQYDSVNSYVRLNTTTNNSFLDSSWTPQWNSLIGYWKMENNWNDTKNSNHGTSTGVTYSTPGKIGSHHSVFNGSAYVTIPSINLNGNFTACTWVNVNSTATNIQTIFSNSAGSISDGFKFYINTYNTTDKKICFETGNGSTIINTSTASNIFAFDKWNHVCVSAVKSTAKVSIFLNGDRVLDSGTTLSAYNTSAALHFGQMANNSWRFNGKMDDFALWSVNLSASEIKNIYERQFAKYTGIIESRVIDAFSSQSWTNYTVTTTLPFYKELPGQSGNESSGQYPSLVGSAGSTSDNNLMSGLVALWHLNENAGSTFADVSGNGNHGTGYGNLTNTECSGLSTVDNCAGNTGVFGRSVTFNGTTASSHYIDIPNSATLENIQESSSTYSIWFKQLRYQSGSIFVKQGYNLGFRQLSDGRVGFDIYSSSNAYSGIYTSAAGTDEWRNLTVTLDYTTGFIRLYLDGNLVQSVNIGVGYTMREYGTNGWRVGTAVACSAGTAGYCSPASGSVDEVALWNRVLNATEIKQLYRRGANRIKYQIRSCTSSDCSDQEALLTNYKGWKGPNGSGLTYFSELYNTTSNSTTGAIQTSNLAIAFSNFSGSGLNITNNRYFQYRAILESDDSNALCSYDGGSTSTACSPELKSVVIGPNHYSTTNAYVTNKSSLGSLYQTLSGFTATLGGNSCSGDRYSVSSDGTNFWYHNGSGWTLSDGTYAKTSTAAQINLNISTLVAAMGVGTLQVRTYLNSDGATPCEIDNILIQGQKN
tara:strand:+ start:18227 stop:21574 length:3348 start_codon:yes stop_codon:yes gene_type:complete